MNLKFEAFYDWYYTTFYKLFNVEKDFRLKNIDFGKPWWYTIQPYKLIFSLEILNELIQAIFGALTPLIIGYAIVNRNFAILVYFAVGYISLEVMNRLILRYFDIAVLGIRESTKYSALKTFLLIDPIHHSTKSSGQIVSKVQGGSDDIGSIIFMCAGSILPVMSTFAVTVLTLASFNGILGVIGISSFLVICSANSAFNYIHSKSFSKHRIIQRDEVGKILVENLSQNALIRSSFATPEQLKRTKRETEKYGFIYTSAFLSYGLGLTITRSLYILSTLSIASVIFYQVTTGRLDQYLGITLIITYINGSSQILRLGSTINEFVEKITGVNDTFNFIHNFGKQTFPVIENSED
jgi:ABC-type multidrug transport system fused ATPase/permease subunit